MRKIQIGEVTLQNNTILAPMAGVTDLPFRVLCAEQGAGLVCMEMVSAKAIYYKNRNTEELMETDPGEHPVSLQLFGSDPVIISEMAKRIEEKPFDILDINMGCPVPKVVNNGEGSALMKNPKLVEEIISRTVKAIHKPVTVKFRKGFDEEHINAVEIARIAEQSGAAAVAVHGRTREQYYAGKADWDIIAQVKAAVSIPVFGNGDVTDGKSAAALLQQTGPFLRHRPAPQPHFDGMRTQDPRPGAGLRPCRQQGQLHHGQAGDIAPDHTARTPHAQGRGKHARACCSRTTAAASFPAIAVRPRPEQLRDATGQAGQQGKRTG